MRAVKAETSLCIFKTRRSLRCFKIPYKYIFSRFFSLLRAVNNLARLYNSLKLSKLKNVEVAIWQIFSKKQRLWRGCIYICAGSSDPSLLDYCLVRFVWSGSDFQIETETNF